MNRRVDRLQENVAIADLGVTKTTSECAADFRVLQLVPGARQAGRLTALTLMDEELLALHRKGVELHTVVHRRWDDATLEMREHVIPRIRDVSHSLGSIQDFVANFGSRSYIAATLGERFLLARVQRWMVTVVRNARINIIHSHWARPGGTAGAAAKIKTGVPLVITLRGADVLNEPSIGYGNTLDPYFVQRLRYALGLADRVICVSSIIAHRAIELGADPSRTVVIHKGVDVERFQPGAKEVARASLGLANRPTILFVGALATWKGMSDLLASFLLVRQTFNDTQLVICGKGELTGDVIQFAKEHQLQDSIRLAGQVDRDILPAFFQACDLFVLPSLTEGSGNVLLEAAACARPSVGTRVGGIPDYIVDGETGLLCEKRCPADLADKLSILLGDLTLAATFGDRARRRVISEFRYEQMVDRILNVYRNVAQD